MLKFIYPQAPKSDSFLFFKKKKEFIMLKITFKTAFILRYLDHEQQIQVETNA